MSTAIVLSGGGARGDFQVGAVRYLYERNIRPTILTACSVGAINAMKLAEGEGDGSDPTRGLHGLISIWRELQSNADMWQEEAWLTSIQNSKTVAFLKQSAASQFGTVALEVGKLPLGPIGWVWFAYNLVQAFNDIGELQRELNKVVNATARSLYNLAPIATKLNDPAKLALDKVQHNVQQTGLKLRLAIVALESGALRYVTETGEMLERNNTTRVLAPVSVLAPECQPIADELNARGRELVSLRIALHKAVNTGEIATLLPQIQRLNDQIVQLTSQLHACKTAHPPQLNPIHVSLIHGTLASASIPFAFPPVKLGSENYVDGGVREIVPIQVAIQAGATDVYAIVASDSTVDPARSVLGGVQLPSFDEGQGTIADIANRVSSDVMPNETVLNEVAPPRGWGANVTLIQPNFDIHDIMTIDPGLIDISMAHGYMRADDTCQAKQQQGADYLQLANEFAHQRRTELIVQTRVAIWELEYAANGFRLEYDPAGFPVHPALSIVPDSQALDEVRKLKETLRNLVRERQQAGGAVPSEVESWWRDWERHPWQPTKVLWPPTDVVSVAVPRVQEMLQAQAAQAIRAAGLEPRFTGSTGPRAWVWRQSPKAGSVVSRGSTVTLQLRTELRQ